MENDEPIAGGTVEDEMSIRDQELPGFAQSLRGYDRVQVDEYIVQLSEYVIQVEDRAAAAESALVECRRELASPGSAGISERLAAILQLANEEADQIRARAVLEGDATTRQAATEAQRTVELAHAQRDAIQLEIDDLSTVRAELLQRLVDLAHEIHDASERYQGRVPGAAPIAAAAVELFDAEALDDEGVGDDVALDEEPVAAPEVDPALLTSTGQTPEHP